MWWGKRHLAAKERTMPDRITRTIRRTPDSIGSVTLRMDAHNTKTEQYAVFLAGTYIGEIRTHTVRTRKPIPGTRLTLLGGSHLEWVATGPGGDIRGGATSHLLQEDALRALLALTPAQV